MLRQTDRQTEISQGKRLSQVIEVNMVNETIKHKTVANTLDTKSGEVKGFRTNYVTKEGYIECPIGGGDGLGFP